MTCNRSEAYRAELFRMALMTLCRVHGFDVLAVGGGGYDPSLQFQSLRPDEPHAMLEAAELYSTEERERHEREAREALEASKGSPFGVVTDRPADKRTLFEGPRGCDTNSIEWQGGYEHGYSQRPPSSTDETYISGWCHGYCASVQCGDIEAEGAYHRALAAAGPEPM